MDLGLIGLSLALATDLLFILLVVTCADLGGTL